MNGLVLFFLAGTLTCRTVAWPQEQKGVVQAGRSPLRVAAQARPEGAASVSIHAQQQSQPSQLSLPDTQRRRSPAEEYRQVFRKIEEGLASGAIGNFSQHFASQVLVNLRGAENGYLSANQTFYVLENYFRARKVLNLSFTTIGESDVNPYATGSAGMNVKGTREIAQVYVSLSHTGDRWVIAQINVY